MNNEDAMRNILHSLFRDLDRRGYFTAFDWEDCMSCGWSAIPEANASKAVFFHEQDAEELRNARVMLAWVGDSELISRLAREHGFNVEWSGSSDQRIQLSI